MRARAAILIAFLVAALAGCDALVDTDQRRLCRALVPALEPDGSLIEIEREQDLSASAAAGVVLRVSYRVQAPAVLSASPGVKAERRSAIVCSFRPAGGGALPVLVAVATDRGAIGPLRLHLLQRYWIDTGLAARSDPAPILVIAGAPAVSRPVAIGMQHALSSLPVIAIYALLATAYSLIYGLVGRINLAFGDLSSLAGYGAFLGFSLVGDKAAAVAVAIALVAGLFTAAMHGTALGQLVIARLAQAPGQHILIATIGVSIFWQEAMRLTQGAGNRWISPLINRPIGIARTGDFTVTVTPMAVIVVVVAGVAASALVIAMRRLRFGLRWRASADDPIAAAMLGINQRAVLVRTFVLAALLAGLGGVLMTLHYGGVGYAGGLVVGLKALVAAIIGGIGSVNGALIGALLVGGMEALWSSVFPIEFRDPALFVALVLMLWLRPGGLYGAPELPSAPSR